MEKETIFNKILTGDSLEIMNSKIPDKSIDLIFADLPFGTTQNKWDVIIPFEPLWEQYKRIIKENGTIILNSHGMFTAKLMVSNEEWYRYRYVWEKSKAPNFLNSHYEPLRRCEDICVFAECGIKKMTYNPQMIPGEPYDKGFRKNSLTESYGVFGQVKVKSNGPRYPRDIIYFRTAESEGKFHPTQKPIELARHIIKTHSNKKDIILDNTCGSGTYLVAAITEGRQFIGIERETKYAKTARRRTYAYLT